MDKPKKIEKEYNVLFESTQVSDLFLSDYLPQMDPLCVKIYLYCLYISKLGQEQTEEAIARTLGIDKSVFMEKLIEMESMGLVSIKGGTFSICDINQKELNRFYRKITSLQPDDVAVDNSDEGKKRNQACKLISDRFFGGVMPGSWYGEIELWFSQYRFSPDVMYMLFQQCHSNRVMTKPYVRKVASEWAKRNIKTMAELEEYLVDYEKMKELTRMISKKLRLNRNLTEYEEEIVSKWYFTYKYDFKIIEIALRKSARKTNFSIMTFDKIITEWFSNGLNDADSILAYEEERRKKYAASNSKGTPDTNDIPQMRNYEEREYDEEFFKNLYRKE